MKLAQLNGSSKQMEDPRFHVLKSLTAKFVFLSKRKGSFTHSFLFFLFVNFQIKGPTLVEDWSPAIPLDPLQTEFELIGLQPNTQYMIVVRLFNEAGVGEQRVQRATSKSRIGNV